MVSHLLNIDSGSGEDRGQGTAAEGDAQAGHGRPSDAQDLKPSAGVEHRQERPRRASPGGRSGPWSPMASTPSCSRRWRKASEGRGGDAQARRAGGRRREGLRRHLARRRRKAGRRPFRRCSTRLRSCPPRRGGVAADHAPRGPRLRRRRRRAPEVYRLTRPLRSRCSRRRALPTTSTRASSRSAADKDCERFVTACRKLRFWDRKDAER